MPSNLFSTVVRTSLCFNLSFFFSDGYLFLPVRLAHETQNGGSRREESLGAAEKSVELGYPRASLEGRKAMADGVGVAHGEGKQ